ncbi:MAG: hypothetical protein QOE70_4597 [Chthoniobacter sp.]|jgi:hypothetical protein|nr:hypothetical protein [Chthoniobacter sp.]
MRALVAKELRSLLAIILFLVCVEIIATVATWWTEFPDMKTLQSELDPAKDNDGLAAVTTFLAVLIAAGLLVRERDDGTLSFLDGLPVSRTRVFASKVLAALTVLTALLFFEIAMGAFYHALSRTSLEKAFPWQITGALFGLHWVLAFTCLGVALALSFLRRWLFLVLGLLAWAFALAKQFRLPHLDLFNPFALTVPSLHEGRWLIPTANLGVQIALGVTGFAVALAGFHAMGDGAHRFARAFARSLWLRLLAGVGTLLIPVVWFALFVRIGRDTAAAKAEWNPAAKNPAVVHESARYSFIHRQSQEREAMALIARADAVHDQVTTFLRAPVLPSPIIVDTTSGLARHNAGQAYWKKVRMLLTGAGEEDAAVLGHETTHVYLDLLSESRLGGHFDSIRFFHEGLASHVEYRQFRTAERLPKFRRVAAVAHAWERMSFEQLANDAELSRKRDRNLAYPFGELFCAAIENAYGEEAFAKIARAFARPDAPKGLTHVELWQDTLQACGYSLETVLAEWFSLLDGLVAGDRAFIDKLPRVKATVEVVEGAIVIHPTFEGRAPGALVCVCRPSADAEEYANDTPARSADGNFRVPRALYERGTFWYQLGWRVKGATLPLLDAWQEVSLRN